ncbi:MAG TPA: respiratory nitrate reductase subunit gamma [Terriglobales bacterium]|nr:respiratory nitrate reductase subunit gamma [Terriglobales bacterium]
MTNATVIDILLLAMLPYVAFFSFFLVTIHRYRTRPFSYSSLSSQFLENREHFWGVVSFHYGILVVLFGHLLGLLIPSQVLLWNSKPLRLYVLEITGLAFALMALVGLLGILHRRLVLSKPRQVTSFGDWLLLALLVVQIGAGIYVAVFRPWGSSWFATSAAPYLWSLFKLNPDLSFLATMPWSVKLHIINGWLIIAVFPFTRLVHVLVAPIPYLWRKPEVVRWYGIRMRPGRGVRARS